MIGRAGLGDHPPAIPARILVADDSESNRYVLATWLRRAGYEVSEASTGGEAIDVALGGSFDLVVLDVNLPDVTGYVVCERIKADPRTAAVPVLHVSATAVQPADRSEGLRRGADGYLVEPVEREELLASVEALLRGAAAQRIAMRLAAQLRGLNDATLAVNEALTLQQLVATIAHEACVLFDAPAIAGVIVDDRAITATAHPHADPVVEHGPTKFVDDVRRAVTGRAHVPASSLAHLIADPSVHAYLAVNLDDASGHRGILLVGESVPARDALNDETEIVLNQYARAANNAVKNVRTYDIERRIALTLQRSLLPAVVPAIPGLDVAVRYEASAEHAEVGGDFYEIFTLDDDRVAVAIGDVVGHSLEAATVMAELRNGIRSYMLEGHDPSATIERLNRLLMRFHPELTATVCCAVFERSTGRCELANAGHPPPLLIRGITASFLPYGGPLLGIVAPAEAPHVFTIAPGDVLLLYTDGLVEVRGETIDDGLARLREVATRKASDLGELCDRLLQAAGPGSPADDIALVAFQPVT